MNANDPQPRQDAPVHPEVVRTVRNPPYGVADLTGTDDARPDEDALVAAGQALTWRAAFTRGRYTAVPVAGPAAVLVDRAGEAEPEGWHDRFVRGLVHRMAGELTVLSMTAALLGEETGETGERREDAESVASAIDGLTRLVTDMDRAPAHGAAADRIVEDTLRTHVALLGDSIRQDVLVEDRGGFTVGTVRSVCPDLTRDALERARSRIGLPWPARVDGVVGDHAGLAGWRAFMEAEGGQMWCRLDEDDALVTELWLPNPHRPPE